MKTKRPIVALLLFLLAIGISFTVYGIQENEELQFSMLGFIGGSSTQTLDEVDNFRLEIELNNETELFFHQSKNEDSHAKIVRKTGDNVEKITAEEALKEIENIIKGLPHPTDSKPLALIEAILDQLKLEQEDIRDFELKVCLNSGEKIKMNFKLDRVIPA
ncbi:YusW family protein [Natroniella acetigena]|uniref:YusW family protein n=1 Tax=Natroniella acetigena TaxID=52004 RepID=UPI00200A865A|nr:YusW family protein [Natroniella acetigena]MCK8827637.1 YusW family protein [Natroniella acetigena]